MIARSRSIEIMIESGCRAVSLIATVALVCYALTLPHAVASASRAVYGCHHLAAANGTMLIESHAEYRFLDCVSDRMVLRTNVVDNHTSDLSSSGASASPDVLEDVMIRVVNCRVVPRIFISTQQVLGVSIYVETIRDLEGRSLQGVFGPFDDLVRIVALIDVRATELVQDVLVQVRNVTIATPHSNTNTSTRRGFVDVLGKIKTKGIHISVVACYIPRWVSAFVRPTGLHDIVILPLLVVGDGDADTTLQDVSITITQCVWNVTAAPADSGSVVLLATRTSITNMSLLVRGSILELSVGPDRGTFANENAILSLFSRGNFLDSVVKVVATTLRDRGVPGLVPTSSTAIGISIRSGNGNRATARGLIVDVTDSSIHFSEALHMFVLRVSWFSLVQDCVLQFVRSTALLNATGGLYHINNEYGRQLAVIQNEHVPLQVNVTMLVNASRVEGMLVKDPRDIDDAVFQQNSLAVFVNLIAFRSVALSTGSSMIVVDSALEGFIFVRSAPFQPFIIFDSLSMMSAVVAMISIATSVGDKLNASVAGSEMFATVLLEVPLPPPTKPSPLYVTAATVGAIVGNSNCTWCTFRVVDSNVVTLDLKFLRLPTASPPSYNRFVCSRLVLVNVTSLVVFSDILYNLRSCVPAVVIRAVADKISLEGTVHNQSHILVARSAVRASLPDGIINLHAVSLPSVMWGGAVDISETESGIASPPSSSGITALLGIFTTTARDVQIRVSLCKAFERVIVSQFDNDNSVFERMHLVVDRCELYNRDPSPAIVLRQQQRLMGAIVDGGSVTLSNATVILASGSSVYAASYLIGSSVRWISPPSVVVAGCLTWYPGTYEEVQSIAGALTTRHVLSVILFWNSPPSTTVVLDDSAACWSPPSPPEVRVLPVRIISAVSLVGGVGAVVGGALSGLRSIHGGSSAMARVQTSLAALRLQQRCADIAAEGVSDSTADNDDKSNEDSVIGASVTDNPLQISVSYASPSSLSLSANDSALLTMTLTRTVVSWASGAVIGNVLLCCAVMISVSLVCNGMQLRQWDRGLLHLGGLLLFLLRSLPGSGFDAIATLLQPTATSAALLLALPAHAGFSAPRIVLGVVTVMLMATWLLAVLWHLYLRWTCVVIHRFPVVLSFTSGREELRRSPAWLQPSWAARSVALWRGFFSQRQQWRCARRADSGATNETPRMRATVVATKNTERRHPRDSGQRVLQRWGPTFEQVRFRWYSAYEGVVCLALGTVDGVVEGRTMFSTSSMSYKECKQIASGITWFFLAVAMVQCLVCFLLRPFLTKADNFVAALMSVMTVAILACVLAEDTSPTANILGMIQAGMSVVFLFLPIVGKLLSALLQRLLQHVRVQMPFDDSRRAVADSKNHKRNKMLEWFHPSASSPRGGKGTAVHHVTTPQEALASLLKSVCEHQKEVHASTTLATVVVHAERPGTVLTSLSMKWTD